MIHMRGYKKGESTLPDEITISAPNASKSTTNGNNHHFFSCRRKRKNSLSNDHMGCLLVTQAPSQRKKESSFVHDVGPPRCFAGHLHL